MEIKEKGMSIGTYMYIWHNNRHFRVLVEEGASGNALANKVFFFVFWY